MKKIQLILLFIMVATATNIFAQQKIHGTVYEIDQDKKKNPLLGVNVYWLGTTDATTTDTKGRFTIIKPCDLHRFLIISYVGYLNDTIDMNKNSSPLEIKLHETKNLQEVVINERALGTHISKMDPIYKEVITSGELKKAACCNLAESFETNASVDVSYSDAITGAKQIQLLGLSGIYSQILAENIPIVKGPAIPYGLSYVPGSWMESIQISKGTSSVINGYESITGQINVEYKKPENTDRFFVNMYANNFGNIESSITSGFKLNENWSTMLMAHGEFFNKRNDMNKDGFIDQPLMTKYNFFNRYKNEKPGKRVSIFGIKVLSEDRLAGQTGYIKNDSELNPLLYGVDINTKRYEAFAKNGFFMNKPNTSIGTMISGSYHNQTSKFGKNNYDVIHKSLYTNVIYETDISSKNHKVNVGPSFTYDDYNEVINSVKSIKEEIVPGIFGQYTYNNQKNFSVIGGLRYDHHNLYGNFITPRLHLKYDINANITLRASAGKGYRSPNIFAENTFLMMTSRTIFLDEKLKAEEAWNYGGSLTYDFPLLKRESNISAEFYRTDFINQAVIDLERNPKEIHIYNLNGKSYSNSFQVTFKTEPVKRLDFTAAYRWNDVMTTINHELIQKPLVNAYKGLLSLSYLTKNNRWQFDFTSQFNGRSRLPNTSGFPAEFQRAGFSPVYTLLNAQITYKIKKLEIYLGGENLTSFTQHDPIISASHPFGDYFDTSAIWGPIMPRMIYVGVRFSIK